MGGLCIQNEIPSRSNSSEMNSHQTCMLIVTLGDSLTAGWTSPGRNDMNTAYGNYISLPDSLNASVIIRAFPGYTVSAISSLVTKKVFKDADVVIVMGGTNDLILHSSVDTIATHFKLLKDRINSYTKSSCKLFILELPPINCDQVSGIEVRKDTDLLIKDINKCYQDLCSEDINCHFVSWFNETSAELVDGVHLNGDSYRRLGEYLSTIIESYL
ncbi:hypothetical protein GEMRC1_004996 [Eukaryota sp. GEM-RC1]